MTDPAASLRAPGECCRSRVAAPPRRRAPTRRSPGERRSAPMRHPRRRRSWTRMPRWSHAILVGASHPLPGHRPVNPALPPRRSVQTRPQSCPCQAFADYPAARVPGYSAYEAGPAGLAVSRAAVWHARAVCPAPVALLAAGTMTVPPAWLRPDCLPGWHLDLARSKDDEQQEVLTAAAATPDTRSAIRGVNGGNPSKPGQGPPSCRHQQQRTGQGIHSRTSEGPQVGTGRVRTTVPLRM